MFDRLRVYLSFAWNTAWSWCEAQLSRPHFSGTLVIAPPVSISHRSSLIVSLIQILAISLDQSCVKTRWVCMIFYNVLPKRHERWKKWLQIWYKVIPVPLVQPEYVDLYYSSKFVSPLSMKSLDTGYGSSTDISWSWSCSCSWVFAS